MSSERENEKKLDMTRRGFMRNIGLFTGVVALTPAAFLAGCGTPTQSASTDTSQPSGQKDTITVFVYSGAWENAFRTNFLPRFEKETGIKVILDPGWWDSVPKLKASPPGNPAFDLIMTDATQGWPAIKEGMFQKVDWKNIPNYKNFAKQVMDNWVVNEGWGVTWPDAVQTIAYNTKTLGFEPKSWADFLRPDLKGKLGLYNSFYMSLYTFASAKVAKEGKPGTARQEMTNNLQGVLDFAKANKSQVKYWWPTSSDMAFNLQQKNVSIGNMHSVDVYPLIKAGNSDLGAFVPSEDRASFQGIWLIPKDTKRKQMAEMFINEFCSNVFQWDYATKWGFPTAIPDLAAQIGPNDSVWANMNPWKKEDWDNVGYYPYDPYMTNWDKIATYWDSQVLRG